VTLCPIAFTIKDLLKGDKHEYHRLQNQCSDRKTPPGEFTLIPRKGCSAGILFEPTRKKATSMTNKFVRSATGDNRAERGFAMESQTGFCATPDCKRLTGVVHDCGGKIAVQLCHASSERGERTKKADEQERRCFW
jgi:hypothetical protein